MIRAMKFHLLNAIQALSQLSYTPVFSSLPCSVGQLLYYSTGEKNVKGFFHFFCFSFVTCFFPCFGADTPQPFSRGSAPRLRFVYTFFTARSSI